MNSKKCTINQILPVEIIQEILIHLTQIQDIKSYRLSCKLWHSISRKFAHPEIHVDLDSRVRTVAFVNDLREFLFLGPRVDKISVTTGQCDLQDLKTIMNFCINLKKIHFGHDVDMNKYLKMLYSNQVKLPSLQEIKIPKPTSLHNGIFALGIYFRFNKTLVSLELLIDPTLNQLLRRNYGGLAMFISNFKQLKSLKLNYIRQGGADFIDLQPVFSKFGSTIQNIAIDGVGELLIKNSANDKHQHYSGLSEITIQGETVDVQNLILLINTLKRSRNMQLVDKVILYSSFNDKFGNTVNTIMQEMLTYYHNYDYINGDNIAQCNPVLLINQKGTNACKWTMTSTETYPYMSYWRNENW